MKKIFTFFLIITVIPVSLKAQRLELRASLNSGFYSYRGSGASAVSRINSAEYTNDPYGSKGGISYGFSFNLRKVVNPHFIFGADLGYEMLRSKVNLDYQDVIGDIASSFKGTTYLNNSFINLFPYAGGRFYIDKQQFDLIGGLDIGYVLSSREKGHAKSTDNAAFDIKTSRDRLGIRTDLRPRIQLSTEFEDGIGLYAGYSHGLRNYTAGLIGVTKDTYSRMWRIGLTYRFGQHNQK